jgi:hypothetical protein
MCVAKGEEQFWDKLEQDLWLFHFAQVVWGLRGLV